MSSTPREAKRTSKKKNLQDIYDKRPSLGLSISKCSFRRVEIKLLINPPQSIYMKNREKKNIDNCMPLSLFTYSPLYLFPYER